MKIFHAIIFGIKGAENPGSDTDSIETWLNDDVLTKLSDLVDTEHNCGFVTLIKLRKTRDQLASELVKKETGLSPKNGKMNAENESLVTILNLSK